MSLLNEWVFSLDLRKMFLLFQTFSQFLFYCEIFVHLMFVLSSFVFMTFLPLKLYYLKFQIFIL